MVRAHLRARLALTDCRDEATREGLATSLAADANRLPALPRDAPAAHGHAARLGETVRVRFGAAGLPVVTQRGAHSTEWSHGAQIEWRARIAGAARRTELGGPAPHSRAHITLASAASERERDREKR